MVLSYLFFMEEGHARLSITTAGGHMLGFKESAFGAELIGEMASHAGFHVGLTISRYINNYYWDGSCYNIE